MSDINKERREFIKDSGALAAGVALASSLPGVAGAQMTPAKSFAEFDINTIFTGLMKDIGGTPGRWRWQGHLHRRSPDLCSHFHLVTAIALPVMGLSIAAAAAPSFWNRGVAKFHT